MITSNKKLLTAAAGAAAGGDSPFGPAYANWDGSQIEFSSTSDANGASASSLTGTQHFYDAERDRVYDAYNGNSAMAIETGSYYLWNSGTSFFPSRPVTSGVTGVTVAYQNSTSYVLFGAYTGSKYVYVYTNEATPAYKGYFSLGSNDYAGGLTFGLYNGDPVIYTNQYLQTTVYVYDLPDLENLSGATVTHTATFTASAAPGYNIQYCGKDASGNLYFLYKLANSATLKYDRIADGFSSGTTATNETTWTHSGATSGYGVMIDWSTEHLYLGGLNNQTLYRYPAV